MVENMEKEGSKVVYEASYLLLPTISQDDAPLRATEIKSKLSSFGAEIISDENPVLIPLAYPMVKVIQAFRQKADQGYFGWVKFEMEASKIEDLKKFFDNHAEILRYLIIKTVRENTLLNGKMKLKSEDKKKVEEKEESFDEVDEVKDDLVPEEVEKEADDLVIA